MKKFTFAALAGLVMVVVAAPLVASAHQREVFEIGGKQYLFVIGSLNEPVFVDDKTGVELRIVEADPKDPGNASATGAKPVEGLDKSLQVEIVAGDKKQTFALEPAFRDPGAYRAPFFPTVETTYAYRVFGTLNDSSVDLTFTCNPAGHPQSAEDASRIELGNGVVRTLKAGAFGCPRSKAAAEFPEKTASNYERSEQVMDIAHTSRNWTHVALGLSVLALIVAGFGIKRKG